MAATFSYKKNYRRLSWTVWQDKLPDDFRMPEDLPDGVRLLAYQPEICPNTGRAHWQGYIAMKSPRSVSRTGFSF